VETSSIRDIAPNRDVGIGSFLTGDLTLKQSLYQMTGWACFALVALRIGVGWHFLSEGVDKLRNGKPFTAPFFGAAKGPFAHLFLDRIWDRDGRVRLNRDQTKQAWTGYRDKATSTYGFDEGQVKRANQVVTSYLDEADEILADPKEEVHTYLKGLDRHAANARDAKREEVSSLAGQTKMIEDDLKKNRGMWLGRLDKLWEGVEKDIHGIATPQQRLRGRVAMGRPGLPPMDATLLDRIIPYSHIAIGACLILGLFTRTAAWAAVAFLLSVVASQPPWLAGTVPTYYQVVEMLAVIVLATAGAGQHAGLDFILRAMRYGCCPPKTISQTPS